MVEGDWFQGPPPLACQVIWINYLSALYNSGQTWALGARIPVKARGVTWSSLKSTGTFPWGCKSCKGQHILLGLALELSGFTAHSSPSQLSVSAPCSSHRLAFVLWFGITDQAEWTATAEELGALPLAARRAGTSDTWASHAKDYGKPSISLQVLTKCIFCACVYLIPP